MKPNSLSRDAVALLERVRRSDKPITIFGATPAESERACYQVVDPLLQASGLKLVYLNQYRWYVRELAKLLRTVTGSDLAFYLEACIRKWLALNLEPRTMTLLLSEIWQRLAPQAKPQQTGKDA